MLRLNIRLERMAFWKARIAISPLPALNSDQPKRFQAFASCGSGSAACLSFESASARFFPCQSRKSSGKVCSAHDRDGWPSDFPVPRFLDLGKVPSSFPTSLGFEGVFAAIGPGFSPRAGSVQPATVTETAGSTSGILAVSSR